MRKELLRSRRRTAASATVVLVAVAVASCGGESGSSGDSGVELTVWSAYGETVDDVFREAVEQFADENQGTTVAYEAVDASAFRERLLTTAATGEGPDIIYISSENVGAYAGPGLLAPLPEDLFEEELAGTLASVPKDEEGRPIALWWAGGYYGFDYRTDFASDAGWQGPLPRTWNELVDFCTATVERDDSGRITREGVSWNAWDTGNLPYIWPTMFDGLLQTQGSTLLNADGTSANLDTPEAAAALQLVHDMIWKQKCSLPSSQVLRPPTAGLFPLMTGASAADFQAGNSPTLYITLGGPELEGKWDRVPFVPKPEGGEDVVIAGGSGWAVTTFSENRDEAYDLLKAMNQPEVLQKLAADPELAVPVFRSDIMTSPEVTDMYAEHAPSAEVYMSSWDSPEFKAAFAPNVKHPNFPDIAETFGNGVIEALEDPDLDIPAFLVDLQVATDAVLQQ